MGRTMKPKQFEILSMLPCYVKNSKAYLFKSLKNKSSRREIALKGHKQTPCVLYPMTQNTRAPELVLLGTPICYCGM